MQKRKRTSPRAWSYSTGEWGKNRVRAFDRGAKGIFLEFHEVTTDATHTRQRVRMALGHVDRDTAKAKADELALAFRRQAPARPVECTISTLFDNYAMEVTPGKAPGTQQHDLRCFAMFVAAFGAERKPRTLSRLDWDRFIAARRRGTIAPPGARAGRAVRDRIIEKDLRLLQAVLNWATQAGDGRGGTLLERNPLKGLVVPREGSPCRPMVTAAQYTALRTAAGAVGPWAECFLVLVHETGHRSASVRQLRWSDVDFARALVTWRGENDKIAYGHTTPLTADAVAVLQRERTRTGAIGDAWIFPARRGNAGGCLTGDAVSHLWVRLASKAALPTGQRFGWHALRRQFANELRTTNLKDLTALGGWKSPQTVVTVYMKPDEATQRAALAERQALRASGE